MMNKSVAQTDFFQEKFDDKFSVHTEIPEYNPTNDLYLKGQSLNTEKKQSLCGSKPYALFL